MSITIAGTSFADAHYDSRGDVLYLTVLGIRGPRGTRMTATRATTSSSTSRAG